MVTFGAILSLKDEFSSTLGKGNKGVEKFGGVAAKVGKVGLGLLVAGTVAAGTAAVYSAKKFSDFESAMLDLKAIASQDLKTGDYEKMYEQAKKLGAATKYSAEEVAYGMKELAAAGMKPEKVMKSIAGVLDLAAAGEVEVAYAAELTANALAQFNLEAEESAHVADVFAKAAVLGTLSVNDMGEAFKYVGAVAGNMANQSIESVSAALAALSNNGIKGSQAGTVLRTTLAKLSAPNKMAATAIKELGMTTTDTAGNLLPLSNLVDQFRVKTEGMGDAQKNAYAKMLVGQEAMTGFIALAKTGGAELDAMTKELIDSKGAAEAMAKIKMSGLAGAWELMTGAIDGVVIALGERLAPLIVKFTDFTGKVADGANGFFAISDAFNIISKETNKTNNSSKSLMETWKETLSPAEFAKTSESITKINEAIKQTQATAQMNQIKSMLPKDEKAKAEGLFNAFSKFKELTGFNIDVSQFMQLSAKFGEVKIAFDGLISSVKTGIATAFQPLFQVLGLEGASNLDILKMGMDGLKATFDGLGQVITFLAPIFSTLIETIIAIAEPIIAMVKPAFDSLMATIQESTPLWSSLGSTLKVVGAILGFAFGAVLSGIITTFDLFIKGANLIVEVVGGAFKLAFKEAEPVIDTVGKAIEKITGFISNLIKKIGEIDFSKIKPPKLFGFGGAAKEASGLSYVHRDEMPALLHKGEAVLTRQENKQYQASMRGANSFSPQSSSVVANNSTSSVTNSPKTDVKVEINIVGDNKDAYEIANEVMRVINQELSVVMPNNV